MGRLLEQIFVLVKMKLCGVFYHPLMVLNVVEHESKDSQSCSQNMRI